MSRVVNLKTVESTMGMRIRLARLNKGWSQRQLKKASGISVREIQMIELETKMPSSFQLIALADALGVKSEYFFRRETIVSEGSEG